MKHAIELVKNLRKFPSVCTIGVAGYPDVHPEATSRHDDIRYLKEKTDAGADFIITQICFSFDALADFIISCRSIGIKCPIIPGIFIPPSYAILKRICELCKINISAELLDQYARLKNEPDKFIELAYSHAFQYIDNIFNWDFEHIYGIHIFSLNKFDSVNRIIKKYQTYFDE